MNGVPETATAGLPWKTLAEMAEAAPPVVTAGDQDQPLVIRADRFADLIQWMQVNWVYAVSALSLAAAGVFFVQYGIEKGLLSPGLRVILAIGFGVALILGGEYVRRRSGDGEASATAYLPSVFSGAGLVSIFAGILAARQMYGLIGAETAFIGLLGTAAVAVVLGWRHGPLLVAVGLLGAAAVPFLVSGQGSSGPWLYGYMALITAVGLAVDAVRRWAWVSVLALALGYAGGALVWLSGEEVAGLAVLLLALPLLATGVPVLRLTPDHDGPTVTEALWRRGRAGWPVFPVRLTAGAGLASSVALLMLPATVPESLLICGVLSLLAVVWLIWADRAAGLTDLAALPVAALLARIGLDGLAYGPLSTDLAAQALELRMAETPAPATVSILLAMGVAISAAAAWRALRAGVLPVALGLGAVLAAPLLAVLIDLTWAPVPVLGAYAWALHVMGLAGLMVLLATRFAARDGADHRRAAHATLSALSLIALTLFTLSALTALTLALAVLVVVAAALDRQFRLPEMGLFIQIGLAVLSYRLLIDPGIDWALEAALWQVLAVFVGAIAAVVAAWVLMAGLERRMTKAALESVALGMAAVLVNVLLTRWLLPNGMGHRPTPQAASLNALPWLVVMLTQLYRAGAGPELRRLRLILAGVAAALAAVGLLVAVVPLNPLSEWDATRPGALVVGPWLLDTLALAYLLPGALLLAAGLRMQRLPQYVGPVLTVIGAGLVALYVGLEIRRFWRGDLLGIAGTSQSELYSYTLVLMLLGAGLLYQAIARRSALLRRIAMAVIAVTVAKVFLIDAAGLTGLVRVVSFAGLGLSLAGLAWLNRWAAQESATLPRA